MTSEEQKEAAVEELLKEIYEELEDFISCLNQHIDIYAEPQDPEHVGDAFGYEIGCKLAGDDWFKSAHVVFHDQDNDFSVWNETETDQIQRVSLGDPDLKKKLIEGIKMTIEDGIRAALTSCREWVTEWEWEQRRFEDAMREFK